MSDVLKRREGILRDIVQHNSGVADDLLKWIVASLLVINSGALASVASSASFKTTLFGLTGLLFVMGILSSLMAAFFTGLGYSRIATGLNIELWNSDCLDNDEYKTIFSKMMKRANRPFVFGLVALLFSVVAFVSGCFALASVVHK